MKNRELLELYRGLSGIKNILGVRINYAIVKNINKIREESESFEKIILPSDKYKEYDLKRIEIVKKHTKKNEKGEPLFMLDDPSTGAGRYDVEDGWDFNQDQEIIDLKKEYADEIEKRESQIKEYDKLLEEESHLELFKIKLDIIPESVSTEQMNVLYKIIEE